MKLTKLREIAMAATPGPWKYDYGNREVEAEKGRRGICAFHGLTEFLDDMTERKILSFEQDDNAKHIATFSPAMVLKLLDVVDCALELQEILSPGFDREHIDCFTIQPMNRALAALKAIK